ncbi:beta-1,3-galactosyltransferase 5-like [Styela clava]
MVSPRKVELFQGVLSFLAAFLFTNGIFDLAYNRQIGDQEYIDNLWEMTRNDLNINFNKSSMRDKFFFTLEPWKVMNNIKNGVFCQYTTQKDLIKIVVMIKSAAEYEARRDIVRQTWGRISHIENVVIDVVFIIGSTTKDVQQKIETEHSKHGDILQFIGVDDYRHIGYKVLSGMQWAKDNLPKDYFYATGDDDLTLDVKVLPRHLRRHMRYALERLPREKANNRLKQIQQMPILCVFTYKNKAEPTRRLDSKYYLDPKEYPMNYFPAFCLGGWYMMPVVSAAKLYEVSRQEKILPMDDVWITGILRQKIEPKLIEPIDSSSMGFKPKIVQHFRGDTDFATAEDILRLTVSHWKELEAGIAEHKHCLRK